MTGDPHEPPLAPEVARAKGLRTVVGHEYHYEPAVLQMAEMVKQGYIGKPLAFNSTYFVSAHIAPRPGHRTWLFQKEASGHPGFRSAHSIERIISVLGEVTEKASDSPPSTSLPSASNATT